MAKNVLIIASPKDCNKYSSVFAKRGDIETIYVSEVWACESKGNIADKIKGSTQGLNYRFIKDILEENPDKYDAIIIDEHWAVLLGAIKESQYKNPIIGVYARTNVQDVDRDVCSSGQEFPKELEDAVDELTSR